MKELICIVCPRGCHLKVEGPNADGGYTVTGNSCPRGAEYGVAEVTHPTRMVTSSVRCAGGAHPRCPVRTSAPIPKELIFEAMKTLDPVELTAPVALGQVVVHDVCGTGVDFIATRAM